MGQDEIMQILKKEKNPLTLREIAEKTNMSYSSVCHCIGRLQKWRMLIESDKKTYFNGKRQVNIKRYEVLGNV